MVDRDLTAELVHAIEIGDVDAARQCAFDIATTRPSPARAVSLTANQAHRLADFIDSLFARLNNRKHRRSP